MKKHLAIALTAALCIAAATAFTMSAQTPATDQQAAEPQTVQPAAADQLTPADRAIALIKQMTVEEKAALLNYNAASVERLGIDKYNWWNEALHGVARNGSATVFPQPIGMAASFDEALLEEVFTSVSDEARVKNRIARENNAVNIYNGVTFWTPNINIFRDPRWGRGMETYGEDPYLTAVLGCAVVRGLQGDPDSDVLKAHACTKHYAVHSGPESTRHSFDAVVSERDLRETYLPAFKALVTKADVQEVMTAYNRFYGDPCAASNRLVNEILRGEWGYRGLVVTDCWALSDFYEPGRHNYVQTPAEAAALAIKNGVDIECGQTFKAIPEAVELGLITEEDLDKCLLRQLVQRFRLGEMDGESPWDSLSVDIVESPEHRALSLKMARESIVLLQNKGGILPLAADANVALIGPNADDAEMMWGNYNPIPNGTVTMLQAMQQRNPELTYFRACGLVSKPETDGRVLDLSEVTPDQYEAIAKKFAVGINDIRNMVRAQKMVKMSYLPELDLDDVLSRLEGIETVIFAGGISPRLEGEEMPVNIPGFSGGDRTSIELPDVQRNLLKALHEAGKKVIFINFSGSAIALTPEVESCDAIVQAWYPGQEGGTAVADVLYGDVNPCGKLPVTFYASDDQLPAFEDYNMAGHTYRYFSGKPLFEFGHGLSYTQFKYKKAKVRGGNLVIKIKNTGKLSGTEVVQLYVSKPDDPEGPAKTLRAFRRVEVPAGRSAKVIIPLDDEMFEWWTPELQNVAPLAGEYKLWYGGSSADENLKTINYKFQI